MREQVDPKTGAMFFIESDEEYQLRQMRQEYPLLKQAILFLLRQHRGPLPDNIQQLFDGGIL